MITFLQGKKVYLTCAATIIIALLEVYLKQIDTQTCINMILVAVGAVGFRSAISKVPEP